VKEHFDELVPWYVNGSLGAEEREWVDRYIAEHPEARAEVDWHHALSQSMKKSALAVPETVGLAKTMALIHRDRPTFSARVTSFFTALGVRPSVAFAGLAVIALQGGMILSLLNPPADDVEGIRTGRVMPTDNRPMLKLNFKPDAKEAEIRHLLMSVQGHLAGGPGQLGDYFVVVPAGKEAAAVRQLESNPIVASVTLAPGLPPRE
jgi:hypothetical protein